MLSPFFMKREPTAL